MYKKVFLIIFLSSFFFMGHTIDYEVVIDDKISEDINIRISKGDIENPSNLIDSVIKEDRYVFLNNKNNIKYNKTITKNGDITDVNMKHTYDLTEFNTAKYFNTCFENTTYINRKDYVYIKGYGGFYCASSNGINIKITTNKLVINNNADSISGNTYTWHVDLKQYKTFKLEFQVDLSKDNNQDSKGNVKIMSNFKIIMGIILGIAVVVILFVINKQSKQEF